MEQERQRMSMRQKRKRMKKARHQAFGILLDILIVVMLGVFIFAGYNLVKELMEYKRAKDEYAGLREYMQAIPEEEIPEAALVVGDGEGDTAEPAEDTYPKVAIDHEHLLNTNSDYLGVLSVPSLEILYPVVKSHDNTEYLTRTFEGNHNASGSIFMDYQASTEFTDFNTLIYGHNMKNGTMFGSLKEFIQGEEGLCDSDPYFYIYTKDRVRRYRIYSYYVTTGTSDTYKPVATSTDYDAYVSFTQRQSNYKEYDPETIDFTNYPPLVTLSTCYGSGGTSFFVVHGALDKVWLLETED